MLPYASWTQVNVRTWGNGCMYVTTLTHSTYINSLVLTQLTHICSASTILTESYSVSMWVHILSLHSFPLVCLRSPFLLFSSFQVSCSFILTWIDMTTANKMVDYTTPCASSKNCVTLITFTRWISFCFSTKPISSEKRSPGYPWRCAFQNTQVWF